MDLLSCKNEKKCFYGHTEPIFVSVDRGAELHIGEEICLNYVSSQFRVSKAAATHETVASRFCMQARILINYLAGWLRLIFIIVSEQIRDLFKQDNAKAFLYSIHTLNISQAY